MSNNNEKEDCEIKCNPLDPIPTKFRKVEGIHKLSRAIRKELTCETSSCSNLPHLLSLCQLIFQSPTHDLPSAVLKTFSYSGSRTGKMVVDLVSRTGNEWVKVSARNPKSLDLLAAGGGNYGSKSIVDHAVDYLECSKENLHIFKPPKITFVFSSGISVSLSNKLESLGITVDGIRIEDVKLKDHERIKTYKNIQQQVHEDNETNSEIDKATSHVENHFNKCDLASNRPIEVPTFQFNNPDMTTVKKLNLDITALLAYISNLTNGHIHHVFKKPILAQQRQFELERPQREILHSVFEGRELYCCETAYKEFNSIVSIVGGPEEKARAKELLKRITIFPDQMSERCKNLILGGQIKDRSLIIFASGDAVQAVTVTANYGFVRSAKTQGVDLPVFLHESRALTEDKENSGEESYKLKN